MNKDEQNELKPSTIDQQKTKTSNQPSLDEFLIKLLVDKKISAVPLQFQYIPVQILSKQFTKFNNPHKFRIHYLGPRPLNSFILHKKYGCIQYQPNQIEPICSKDFNRYGVNLRKIIQSSYINQGLRTNNHYRNAIFYRAFQGMNPTLNLNEQIIFNSAFESGNLDCVIKPKVNEFDLFLRIDSNTRGHTQWYYFSIKNGKKNQKIKLNICNITKGKTLYEQGMKPYIFSRKKKQKLQESYSWQQGGQNINFEAKSLRYDLIYENIKVSCLYELSFCYKFQEDDDEVFFAYSIPFTYSELLFKIYSLSSQFIKHQILGKTFTGVDIPILHISNFQSESYRIQRKKNILITGRVHPGQSNSSHMINGFIQFLLSDTIHANELRERVNFFIVPMLNPDGVIMGNSRTSAAGKDLNRQFRSYKFQLYPQVSLIKNLAIKLKRKYGLFMYLDFHGHSRKKNTFFYGPPYTLSDSQYYKCRVFPRLVQKINSSFRYYGCSFSISQQKRKAGRSVMFQQMKIPYTYTIQSSIGLYYDFQKKITSQFQKRAWAQMGKDIGAGLSQFVVLQQEYQQILRERILNRQKQKDLKTRQINKMHKQEDQIQANFNQNLVLQIRKNDEEEIKINPFQGIMEEIKEICGKNTEIDQDVQSDDYDTNQDLQAIKLNEFNNLIVQSAQKEEGFSINIKFYQDNLIQQFPSRQLDGKTNSKTNKQHQNELKNSKKQIKASFLHSKFRNQHLISKSQSIKNKESISNKKKQMSSQVKSYAKKVPKNFIIANKQKYSIATKNFLINQNNRYQIIELPKNIQNIRKQLTKGRILINNLFQNKLRTDKEQQKQHFQNFTKNQQFSNQRNVFTASRLKRFQIRQTKFNPFGQNHIQNIQKRSNSSHFNRNSISSRQNAKLSPKRKQGLDKIQYQTFADLQVDNLAMTIKTYKGS